MNAMTQISATLRDRLEAARKLADNGGIPLRRKDEALYRILADCLAICEMVVAEGIHDELREAVRVSVDSRTPEIWGKGLPRSAGNAGRGKRYIERASDEYILVCRYVLSGDTRGNFYRYAAALREAGRRRIASEGLADWLTQNGGVNTLFMGREVQARTMVRKTLTLNQSVTVPKDEPFTLTLRMDHRGFFDVVSA